MDLQDLNGRISADFICLPPTAWHRGHSHQDTVSGVWASGLISCLSHLLISSAGNTLVLRCCMRCWFVCNKLVNRVNFAIKQTKLWKSTRRVTSKKPEKPSSFIIELYAWSRRLKRTKMTIKIKLDPLEAETMTLCFPDTLTVIKRNFHPSRRFKV